MNTLDNKKITLIFEYIQIYSKLCRLDTVINKSTINKETTDVSKKSEMEMKLAEIETTLGLNTNEILDFGFNLLLDKN